MRQSKKQPPKKRAYKKKAAKWTTIESIHIDPPEPIIEKEDKEVEQLTLICEVIESWNDAQKKRCLQFLFSKYGKYINPFKI